MCIPNIITDESVINTVQLTCYSMCGSDMVDADNNSMDTTTNDFNGCCNSVSTTSGYSATALSTCTTVCKFYYNHYISLYILAIYLPN